MTTRLDILGTDKRCMWYMELHYGSSFKTRTQENLECMNCRGYDFDCGMYAPFVKQDYSAVDKWLRNQLDKKRAKTLDSEVRR